MCRGLITDLEGNVICRPFPKFFNLGEHQSPENNLPVINWAQGFDVSEKMDGSLGVAYPTPDGPRIATRGSFTSEQACRANDLLSRMTFRLVDGYTHLFEIIYPENRIVVNYGDREELVLLDVIDNETGRGASHETLALEAYLIGCRLVKHHRESAYALHFYDRDCNDTNREGVVVRFNDGTRIKIKLAEYCRLHKLITGVNVRHIWEYLRDGRDINELIDRVPDEFMKWVEATVNDLESRYALIQQESAELFAEISGRLGGAPRKAYAMEFVRHPVERALLFLLLDEQPVDHSIWKQLKPDGATCFAVADE